MGADATDVRRLAAFGDGVFVLALGLLVLQIPVPPAYVVTDRLHDVLGDDISELFGFGLSFLVIGGFWVEHHRLFDRIAKRDEALLWADLGFLMCIASLPFAAGLLGKHLNAPVAVLFYSGAMFITGLAAAGLWWYVSGRPQLWSEPIDPGDRRRVLRRHLATPLVFALAAPAAELVFDIGNSGISLATILWIIALPTARYALRDP